MAESAGLLAGRAQRRGWAGQPSCRAVHSISCAAPGQRSPEGVADQQRHKRLLVVRQQEGGRHKGGSSHRGAGGQPGALALAGQPVAKQACRRGGCGFKSGGLPWPLMNTQTGRRCDKRASTLHMLPCLQAMHQSAAACQAAIGLAGEPT